MLAVVTLIAYWIVILLHVFFAVLEMVLWKKRAPKAFGISKEFAQQSAALASNQGLYNLFLVAALLIGFFASQPLFALYGLGCVIVAGIWGAITVNKRIFFIQALPAIVALGLYYLSA